MSGTTACLSSQPWDNRANVGLDTEIQLGEVTPADEQRARLTVCELAWDAEDAALLLAMLGLDGAA